MKVSYNWLQEFIDKKLPQPEKLAELLTMHSFEVASIESVPGKKDWVMDIDILPNRAPDCLSHLGIARECAALLDAKIKNNSFNLRLVSDKEIKKDTSTKIKNLLEVEVKEANLCPRYGAAMVLNVKIGPAPEWMQHRLKICGLRPINNIVDLTNYIMLEIGQPMHAFDFDKLSGSQKKKKIIVRKSKSGEEIMTLDGQKRKLDKDILIITDSKKPIALAGLMGGLETEVTDSTQTIILESANFNNVSVLEAGKKLNLKTESGARFEKGLDHHLSIGALDYALDLIAKMKIGRPIKEKIDIFYNKFIIQRLLLDLDWLNKFLGVKLSYLEVTKILSSLGFQAKQIDFRKELIKKARTLLGRPYRYGASTSLDAPQEFDCSSLTRYLYRQIGIEIPRLSIEQIDFGRPVDKKNCRVGDLLFSKGKQPYFNEKYPLGVGHVGIYAGQGKVIHASGKKQKVVEGDAGKWFKAKDWRGVCRILDTPKNQISVEVPLWRLDIFGAQDLAEEVGRLYSYEKISSELPRGILAPPLKNDEIIYENQIRQILFGAGLSEVYNYSFMSAQEVDDFKFAIQKLVAIKNPISAHYQYLRPSILPNLLKNLKGNLKYFERVGIFEMGKIFFAPRHERKSLVWAVTGQEPFYELKGQVDLLLNRLGISDIWYDDYEPTPEDSNLLIWHPSRRAEIKVNGREIGFLGEIHPDILNKLGLKSNAGAVDLNLEKVFDLAAEERIYAPPSKYPTIIRDIALLVDKSVRVESVLNILNIAGGALVRDIDLFDIYESEELPEEKKSLAFHIIYQADDRTLQGEEVDALHNKIIRAARKNGWEVR